LGEAVFLFKILFFVVLIPITILLLCAFVNGLIELYYKEQEDKKRIVKEGIEGYLNQIFGYGTVQIFKSILDAEGTLRYIIYLPHYEWFKSPTYKWYEVYATDNGYNHIEIEG
jgi:hypothetical protein